MTSDRVFWRSLEAKEHPEQAREHAAGSDIVKRSIDAPSLIRLRRRQFLTLSGAISALAGVGGCIRRPVEKIMPYTELPEDVTVGVASHYASVLTRRGEALGVVVQSSEGRPTKVEGNPEHPASAGSTDLHAQAALLDLYDAERARTPTLQGAPKTDAAFDAVLAERASWFAASSGEGLRILSEPTLSPTFLRLRSALKAKLPAAVFHTYAPVSDSNERAGMQLAFGRPLLAHHRVAEAEVIVALDSDFLMTETGSVEAARDFANGRHMDSASSKQPNRLYVVEPTMTVTGSNADHRLSLPAQSIAAYAKALAAALGVHGISLGALDTALGGPELASVAKPWTLAVAKDLAVHKGASLVIAGSRQPPAVHALVAAMNSALGNVGKAVTYVTPVDAEEPDHFSDIAALARDMAAGKVQTLLVLGGNPVLDAPADVQFEKALAQVPLSICSSGHRHETGERCTWHVPRAHELESWGDQASRGGAYSVQQPLIAPLFGGRTDLSLLAALGADTERDPHLLVKATARAHGASDELRWQRLLQRGVGPARAAPHAGELGVQGAAVAAAVRALPEAAAPEADALEVVFLADNKLLDGRHANNAWLQELPDPITRITWDNAALIAPATAKALGIASGDMVRLTSRTGSIERSVDIVAWVQPGQARGSIGLPLGWGRKRGGKHALGAGFDVYPLRTSEAPHFAAGVKLAKLGTRYPLSQTQEHDVMEGRPIALDAALDAYRAQPDFGQWGSPDPSPPPLWKTQDYSQGPQWGMVIDLNRCIGCSACAVACQAENNIPVVGKEQVARGREMAWLRIDRYYVGDDADEPEVAFQPISCQHCEQAPCENVCPVNATSHSPEGLNDIAYNRCIGTRYCMNNCPYKVRRFNFLNFNLDIPETQKMVYNPNVTLRFRGVIEKCTYCVQRIQSSKIAAKREGRELADGDIVTACQQACSARAITFGDIRDENSAVSKARRVDRNYALLADVGTQPRTRFLGKIRNPNPEMIG
jgi:Fe-S-cluster-containing dehydrogenase component/anaerobic selenocysteine-containing dehydrogenase